MKGKFVSAYSHTMSHAKTHKMTLFVPAFLCLSPSLKTGSNSKRKVVLFVSFREGKAEEIIHMNSPFHLATLSNMEIQEAWETWSVACSSYWMKHHFSKERNLPFFSIVAVCKILGL